MWPNETGGRINTVFFDVDTQIDFLFPSGALYVPGAETILDRLAALNRYAAAHGIPVISTMDAHTEDDPEFRQWPHHCVTGTAGQQKPSRTLLEKRVVVPNKPCELSLNGAQQVLLEKQTLDCFTNVNLGTLLEKLSADRYVVYGVVTEICVKIAALGLLNTSRRVEIVTDAVRGLDEADVSRTLTELTSAGAALTTAAEVTAQ
jgi:nicotinamidase/pyrazinamidase